MYSLLETVVDVNITPVGVSVLKKTEKYELKFNVTIQKLTKLSKGANEIDKIKKERHLTGKKNRKKDGRTKKYKR